LINWKLLLVFVLFLLLGQAVFAALQDYFVFGFWNPGGHNFITGMGGYIDFEDKFGRGADKEYIVFMDGPSYCGNHTAYIYDVTTNGNPALHPNETDPELVGPIAPRQFTLVSSQYIGNYCSGHDNAFHIDETGIYYGSASRGRNIKCGSAHGCDPGWASYKSCGVYHWDFDWTPIGCEVSGAAPGGAQTLARNTDTGDWWSGTSNRKMFRWKQGGSSWQFEFSHPTLFGSHHDGMTYANGSLFISDMTSDHILRYELDPVTGDPTVPYADKFDYSAAPVVENMGLGPNYHIWVSGWNAKNFYELGGGRLQEFLNKAPNVIIDTESDENNIPFPAEFDATDSNDPDGVIGLWEWDFDGDGLVDIAGHSDIGEEARNIGGIPYSDAGRGFSCSSGQQLDVNGVVYCKYASLEDSIRDWFDNVEQFKNQGIVTAEELMRQKFDPYIWGASTAQKIKTVRTIVKAARYVCTKREYYKPPSGCSDYCEVKDGHDVRIDTGECILPDDIRRWLENANSPAASHYQLIFDLGKAKGIDPAVALAFFGMASNYGGRFDLITWVYLEVGDYTVTATATDDLGLEGSATVEIKALPPENLPPVADFKAIPREGYVPLTVDFDASPSFDPNGDTLTYRWTFSDRPDIKTDEKFDLVFSALDPIDITLTVYDPSNEFDTVTKSVLPYSLTGITNIEAAKVKVEEKAKVKVECPHAIPITLSVFKIGTGTEEIIVENVPYTCNDGFLEFGPNLKGGIYEVVARTDARNCSKCSDSQHFVVSRNVEKVKAPDIPPVFAAAIALGIVLFLGKKRD